MARAPPEFKDDAAAPPPEGVSGLAMLVKTFLVLGVVVALIYLVLNFGLRRLMGIPLAGPGGGLVTVVERIPLDLKRSLFVVRAGGEYLLLGGGEANLSLITKLDAAEVERLRPPSGLGDQRPTPFLVKLLRRRGGPPAS